MHKVRILNLRIPVPKSGGRRLQACLPSPPPSMVVSTREGTGRADRSQLLCSLPYVG